MQQSDPHHSGGLIQGGPPVNVTYNTPYISKETASEILRTTNAAVQHTGMKLLENADRLFSFHPKLL